MKKYINEEELLDNIGILYEYHKEQMNFVAYSTIEDVCQIINDMPSEDVVEVVRCKDCAHYIDGMCYVTNRSSLFKYNVNIHSRKENDFCSYGERRTNND